MLPLTASSAKLVLKKKASHHIRQTHHTDWNVSKVANISFFLLFLFAKLKENFDRTGYSITSLNVHQQLFFFFCHLKKQLSADEGRKRGKKRENLEFISPQTSTQSKWKSPNWTRCPRGFELGTPGWRKGNSCFFGEMPCQPKAVFPAIL